MKGISRRDLFRHLADLISDHLGSIKTKVVSRDEDASIWVPLTRSSSMTPGNIFSFDLQQGRGVLHSNGYGLYAILDDGRSVAIRVNRNGFIEINTKVEWPPGQVLSHMTGLEDFSE